MSTYLYHIETGVIFGRFNTPRGAKISWSRKHNNAPQLAIIESTEYWNTVGSEMVTVKSLQTGKDVEIRKIDRGTVCDPSTERYWTA